MEIYKLYKKTQKATWEVSNYGNVKMNGKPYECRISASGYKTFGNRCYLHKAVAKLFIPNPEDKPQVDHIDTNKLNNHIDNLRWCTHKENCNNPKTRQHNSEAKTGKHQTEETKQKMSESHKGEKHHFYGKTFSDEHKQNLSESHINNKGLSKSVLQFTKSGEFVAEYPSTREAHRQTNINHISECCNGKLKSAGSFVWKWKEA